MRRDSRPDMIYTLIHIIDCIPFEYLIFEVLNIQTIPCCFSFLPLHPGAVCSHTSGLPTDLFLVLEFDPILDTFDFRVYFDEFSSVVKHVLHHAGWFTSHFVQDWKFAL